MPFLPYVAHQLLLAPAAWLPCALDRRRLASASVSSKAIIAILSKTRPIARMLSSLSISFPHPTLRERAHRRYSYIMAETCELWNGKRWAPITRLNGLAADSIALFRFRLFSAQRARRLCIVPLNKNS